MSLAMVVAMGTVCSLWATAMMLVALPTYQKTASLKYGATSQAAAEAALDYAVSKLNTAINNGSVSALDATSVGTSKSTQIDTSLLSGISDSNATLNVLVENIQISAPVSTATTDCLLYDASLANMMKPASQGGIGLANPYRRVTATAKIGNVTRAVRCMLIPRMNSGVSAWLSTQSSSGSSSSSNNATYPFTAFAAMGQSNLNVVGLAGTNSYVGYNLTSGKISQAASTVNGLPGPGRMMNDPRIRADLGSLTTVNQVGSTGTYRGMAIGGTQFEFCNPIASGTAASANTAQTYNAVPVSQAPWCSIYDNVMSNYPNYGTTTNPSRGLVYADTTNLPSSQSAANSGYVPRGMTGTTASSSIWNPSGSPAAATTPGAYPASNYYMPSIGNYGTNGIKNIPANQQPWNNVFGVSNVMGAYPFVASDGTSATGDLPSSVPNAYTNPAPPKQAIPTGSGMGGVVSNAQQYTKPTFPTAPSAPSSASSIGSVSLSGSSILKIVDGATPPSNAITLTGNSTLSIPPGEYKLNSLAMSGTSQIQILSSSPTNFYMSGATTGSTVVSVANGCNINMVTPSGQAAFKDASGNSSTSSSYQPGFSLTGTNGLSNNSLGTMQLAINPSNPITEVGGSAQNLTLYYGGSQTMNLLGVERMVVYASNPNCTVNIGAQGSSLTRAAELYGSVAAGVVQIVSNYITNIPAYLHFDVSLKPSGGAMINPNTVGGSPVITRATFASASNSNSAITAANAVVGYKVVTWQEAKTCNIDPTLCSW